MRLFNLDMDIHRENGRSGLTEKEGNSQKINSFITQTMQKTNPPVLDIPPITITTQDKILTYYASPPPLSLKHTHMMYF